MCHSVKFPWLFFLPIDLFVFQFILFARCPCQCYFFHLCLAPSSQVFTILMTGCFCIYMCSFLHSWSVQCLMFSLSGSQSIAPCFCVGIFPGKNKAPKNFWFNKYFMFFHPSSLSLHLSWLLSQNLTWCTKKVWVILSYILFPIFRMIRSRCNFVAQ